MRFHSMDIRPRRRRKRRLAKLVSHLFARLAANELNQKLQ